MFIRLSSIHFRQRKVKGSTNLIERTSSQTDHNSVSPTSATFKGNDYVRPLIIVIQINDKQTERSWLLKSIINIY